MALNNLTTLIPRIKNRLFNKAGISFSDYQDWIRKNEPRGKQLAEQRAKANDFDYKPLISLVIPVWNTPKNILNETIASVLQQTYGNLELCIADGNSSLETRQILSGWVKMDVRINIKYLDENKGIAVNSNKALSLAKGEFVAFLDHDDLLAPFALFEIANLLQRERNVDIIYSDEDKMSRGGRRFDPFFKPDFSLDYLRSLNYMPHFLIIRKSLGDNIGWFREGYEGAQDYDLILRSVEKAQGVAHIPKILYHWRTGSASTANSAQAKPYANESGKKALREHLDRVNLSAVVSDGPYPTFYHASYSIPDEPLVSIIIPSHDHADDLRKCIQSILGKKTYENFEIIVVENNSKEAETFQLYEELTRNSRVRIIDFRGPFNYSRLNNWAVGKTNGQVILFLNNDVEVINQDWLDQMLQCALRPDVGAVGAKLYYPDGRIQHGGVIIGIGGTAGYSHKYFPKHHPGYFGRLVVRHNVSAVSAACLMLRREVFDEIQGFDENYVLAFGDVDLCLSLLKKGYLNVWSPYAELYHYESRMRVAENMPGKQDRFVKELAHFESKWEDFLSKGDPYYSPNLTLDGENFRISR